MSVFRRVCIILAATLALIAGLAFVWRAPGPRSISGAFLLNLLPTSWLPSVRSALVIRLPAGYYPLRPFEKDARLYERLGIRLFQKLMRTSVFGICNRAIPRSSCQKDFVGMEREMRFAETSHVLAFLFALSVTVFSLAKGWRDAAGYLMGWNILINLYPAMLQRFNRGRLLHITAKLTARTNGPGGWNRNAASLSQAP